MSDDTGRIYERARLGQSITPGSRPAVLVVDFSRGLFRRLGRNPLHCLVVGILTCTSGKRQDVRTAAELLVGRMRSEEPRGEEEANLLGRSRESLLVMGTL